MRDAQSLEAEAMLADKLLTRTLDQSPASLVSAFGDNPVDRWLNAVVALGVDPASDVQMSGSNQGVKTEGGLALDLAGMSAVACALLAAGKRPGGTNG